MPPAPPLAPVPRPYVAVVGPGQADEAQLSDAEVVGRELALVDAVVVTGGLGGVMLAASRGAQDAGGVTVGLLPGEDRTSGNSFLTVALATGLGELRNGLVVRAADALVAIGGEHGTLAEIALALKMGKPVVGLGTWDIGAPLARMHEPAAAAREAARLATKALQS